MTFFHFSGSWAVKVLGEPTGQWRGQVMAVKRDTLNKQSGDFLLSGFYSWWKSTVRYSAFKLVYLGHFIHSSSWTFTLCSLLIWLNWPSFHCYIDILIMFYNISKLLTNHHHGWEKTEWLFAQNSVSHSCHVVDNHHNSVGSTVNQCHLLSLCHICKYQTAADGSIQCGKEGHLLILLKTQFDTAVLYNLLQFTKAFIPAALSCNSFLLRSKSLILSSVFFSVPLPYICST